MSESQCPYEVNITTQADVDNWLLSPCINQVFPQVNIQNSTGVLNFTTLTTATYITASQNPQLEILEFPLLSRLKKLTISDADSLRRISLPDLPWDNLSFSDMTSKVIPSFSISDAPAFRQLDVQNMANVRDLSVIRSGGFDTAVSINARDAITDILNFIDVLSNITNASQIDIDDCLLLPSIVSVDSISISARSPCFFSLPNLKSAGDIYLGSISGFSFGPAVPAISGSLKLENSTLRAIGFSTSSTPTSTIGYDANITSNWGSNLDFSSLASVGNSLFLRNNTNCTINFEHLTKVASSLSITDNVNTTIPIFPRLKRVGNITLRGYIDTSHESNIFPALKYASGSITIEPWNDFNCSKLMSQQRDGIIHSVYCNGTGNGTDDTDIGRPETSEILYQTAGLSQGAWAGIGTAIGVVVIVGIWAAIWCTLRFRRLLKDIYEGIKPPEARRDPTVDETPPTDVRGLHEVSGQGIIREKPDDHLHEMFALPAEKLDEYVYEMSSAPPERPSSSRAPEEGRLKATHMDFDVSLTHESPVRDTTKVQGFSIL